MKRNLLRAGLGSLLVLPLIAAAWYGGWATTTVEDLPDYAVAGQPLELTFTVRQHGQEPIRDLRPMIHATVGKTDATVTAVASGKPGTYKATLTPATTGDLAVTIKHGFGKQKLDLIPIQTVAGGAAPITLAEVARGHRLFVAKGCVTCHVRQEVSGSGELEVGPNLTGKKFAADYLAKFLADPSIKPATTKQGQMPDLDLKAKEIASLTAFINSGSAALSMK